MRLRDFFRFRRNHSNVSDYADLLTAMSPALRAHVSGFIHRKWVRDVRAFKGFSGDAVAAIAMHLESQAFSACESIFKAGEVSDMMYIVERGVVLVDQRVVVRGGTFGEDMMYRSHSMRRTHHAVTLTHVVLLSMHHEMLNSVIGAFPMERKKLRKAVVRVVFRDCVLSKGRRSPNRIYTGVLAVFPYEIDLLAAVKMRPSHIMRANVRKAFNDEDLQFLSKTVGQDRESAIFKRKVRTLA